MNNRYFNIYIDTGGTFTDCIAVDETGKQYRQKVLSSSRLRGTIVKVICGNKFQISNTWSLQKDILKGFSSLPKI